MYVIHFDSGIAVAREDPPSEDNPEQEFPVESLAPYLNSPVTLSPDTTLRHVWSYLEKDAAFFGIVFKQAMGNFGIEAFIEQAKKSRSPSEGTDPLNCIHTLELGWDADVWEDDISITTDFSGSGVHTDMNAKDKVTRECSWAVELTLINDLLDYPLRLDPTIVFREQRVVRNLSHKVILEGNKEWTIYDMYYGILFEITFCGPPNKQIGKLADLDQRIEECRDVVRKLHKQDDVEKELLDE